MMNGMSRAHQVQPRAPATQGNVLEEEPVQAVLLSQLTQTARFV